MCDVNLAEVRLVIPENGGKDSKPPARSGHRIVVTTEAVYSIGGYNPEYSDTPNNGNTIYPLFNELWKFNLTTGRWKLLETRGVTPTEMASHTALLIGNKLFVHGGTGTPFGSASSNELNVCDLKSRVWKHITTEGERPERLYGHTLTVFDGSTLYMFGGTTGYEYRNTLHRLSLLDKTWSALPVDWSHHVPEGRYRHETVCASDYLYVLGGGASHRDYGFEKIDAFNVSECRWEHLTCHALTSDGYPSPRRCHAAIRYKRGAYIIGGYDREEVFDDVWRLDLDTLEWRLVRRLRQPVYFHSADVTADGCVYIYGGVNRIDDERNSDMYTFCLDPPPLRDQCWKVLYKQIDKNKMANMERSDLLQLGIPASFLSRL